MKFSENWLRELVEIKADRTQLAHALTMAGLEVEELTPLGDDLAGVVVAEIVGAKLPGDISIKAARLRGVESSGMLCSAKELGIDADASGLLELPADAPVGKPLADYLGLPDASIELKLTPNRPDCLGLYGLAHDVAALFGSRVKTGEQAPAPVTSQARRGIRLEAGKDAPRYLGRVVEGIDATARTPLWLAER